MQQSTCIFDSWLDYLDKKASFPDISGCKQKDPSIPFPPLTNGDSQEFTDLWEKSLIINTVGITRTIWDIQHHLKGL